MEPEEVERKLNEALAPLLKELGSRVTVQEVDAMVQIGVNPLKKDVEELTRSVKTMSSKMTRLLEGQQAHGRIENRVSTIEGSLATLSQVRSDELQILHRADVELRAGLNATIGAVANLNSIANDLKGQLFGYTDRPNDTPPIMKQLMDVVDSHRLLVQAMQQGMKLQEQRFTVQAEELRKEIQEAKDWIENRKKLERWIFVKSRGTFDLISGWISRTWAGKIVAAIIGGLITIFIGDENVRTAVLQAIENIGR